MKYPVYCVATRRNKIHIQKRKENIVIFSVNKCLQNNHSKADSQKQFCVMVAKIESLYWRYRLPEYQKRMLKVRMKGITV
jgi:hypothetical protein